MVLLRRSGDAGAVHEDDFPDAPLFLEEGGFQPLLVCRAGGVGDAPFIDVCDPRRVTADADVRFSHVPFIAFARCMLGLDKGDEVFSVESDASVEYVKV